jgi:hypothetical protein
MRFKKSILALAACALVSGAILSVGAPASVLYIAPGKVIGDFRVENAERFKGANQVVIGQFSVGFFVKKVDYDGGGFLSANNEAKAIGHLQGMFPNNFQAITDAIYDDFTVQLEAQGVKIVDPAAYKANKYYAKVKYEVQGSKALVPLKKEDKADAALFWPSQLGGRNENMLATIGMFNMNMGKTYTAQYDYARTSKVPVLNVVYYVDFAAPAKTKGGNIISGTNVQTITVSSQVAMSQFGSQMQIMDVNGKVGKMTLNTPVIQGGNFADIRDITSGSVRTAEAFADAFGKGNYRVDRRFGYTVTDKPAYSRSALAAGHQTSEMFTKQLVALR